MNICNAFTKFEELELLIQRVNRTHPISIICLNECWLNEKSAISSINLTNYNMVYQTDKCPGHSHCGLIMYVHDTFRSEEVHFDQITTGWEHLTVQILHRKHNSKKSLINKFIDLPKSMLLI